MKIVDEKLKKELNDILIKNDISFLNNRIYNFKLKDQGLFHYNHDTLTKRNDIQINCIYFLKFHVKMANDFEYQFITEYIPLVNNEKHKLKCYKIVKDDQLVGFKIVSEIDLNYAVYGIWGWLFS